MRKYYLRSIQIHSYKPFHKNDLYASLRWLLLIVNGLSLPETEK